MKTKYNRKYKWALSTIFRGDSDILELFIMWYHDKVDILTIAMHNPSKRVVNLLNDIIEKQNIKNVKIKIYESEIYFQVNWVNEIFNETLKNYEDIDIYAHVDLDEFIYRFDIIEENFKPNTVIKMPSLGLLKKGKNQELKWSTKPYSGKFTKKDLSYWDKTIYCIGDDVNNVKYYGGQHNFDYIEKFNKKLELNHLSYPIFYHIPYRNDIQTYSKIGILINLYSNLGRHIEKTNGVHVLKKFLDLYSPEYVDIFNSDDTNKFKLELNEKTMSEFANYNIFFDVNQINNNISYHKIDNIFYKKFFKKYYNEGNSLLDYIEQDFVNKMISYKKSSKSNN